MLIHSGYKPFTCGSREQIFVRKTNLTWQMLIHSGGKPYKSETCGKAFTQIATLNKHALIHTCGKAFTVKSSLNNHVILIHIPGDKPHGCHICGTVFAQKSSVLRHFCRHLQYKNVKLVEKCPQ